MTDSPVAATTAAFEAWEACDWQALFSVLDPVAIEGFKAQLRRGLEMTEGRSILPGRRKRDGMLERVFAVDSLEEFDALPAAFVLRRFLVVSRGRFRQHRSPERRRQILGEVYDGHDKAHVVFRERWPDQRDVDLVRVISVRRTARGWRVALGGGLVVDESRALSISYGRDAVDPTEGESDFSPPPA